jgi:hypothetical protein
LQERTAFYDILAVVHKSYFLVTTKFFMHNKYPKSWKIHPFLSTRYSLAGFFHIMFSCTVRFDITTCTLLAWRVSTLTALMQVEINYVLSTTKSDSLCLQLIVWNDFSIYVLAHPLGNPPFLTTFRSLVHHQVKRSSIYCLNTL